MKTNIMRFLPGMNPQIKKSLLIRADHKMELLPFLERQVAIQWLIYQRPSCPCPGCTKWKATLDEAINLMGEGNEAFMKQAQ